MPSLELPPELVAAAGASAADLFRRASHDTARIPLNLRVSFSGVGWRDFDRLMVASAHALTYRAAVGRRYLLGHRPAPHEKRVTPLAIAV